MQWRIFPEKRWPKQQCGDCWRERGVRGLNGNGKGKKWRLNKILRLILKARPQEGEITTVITTVTRTVSMSAIHHQGERSGLCDLSKCQFVTRGHNCIYGCHPQPHPPLPLQPLWKHAGYRNLCESFLILHIIGCLLNF